jgi:predicted transcriptional regulator
MGKKRSSMQIKADILKVIDSGEKVPTHIMYKANLSWNPMKKRILELLQDGFILVAVEGNPEHNRYHLTAKGRWALKTYRELVETG